MTFTIGGCSQANPYLYFRKHELKRLIDQAMPSADAATRQQLLIHQFLTSIPTEVSKRLQASGEIDDLEQLIQRAKLFMTIDAKEKPKENSVAIQPPIDQVEALTASCRPNGADCHHNH